MVYKNIYSKPKIQKHGFTLVEMLIIAPIVIFVIGIFISAIISMTGSVLVSRGANALSYTINDALSRIDQDVKASAGFLATNNISTTVQGLNDDNTPFKNASSASTTDAKLILNAYATDQNPLTQNRNIIDAANTPYTCGTLYSSQNANLMTNIVYFVKNNTLWRRVIMPALYNSVGNTGGGCILPWQKPTCTPGYSAPFCKANDQRLVDGVTGITITYWTNDVPPVQITNASDYNQSDIARQNAMQTAASVNVTITAAKALSGRTVTQTGTIRSLGIQTPTMLTQPSSQTVTSGNNATFTTAAFGTDMAIKWEQSTDNGITWSTISGATSPTLTFASSNTMDGNMYHAIYTNSYGQVTSSPARLTVNVSGWTPLTLLNSWGYYGSPYNTAGYMKTSSGIVLLKGLIQRTGTPTAGEIIATLPQGYRPSVPLVFGTGTYGATSARVDVYPNGNIIYTFGSGTFVGLDNIHFVANTGRYTSTPVTQFYNTWSNYGTGGWGNVSYVVDTVGRVNLQGLLSVPTSGLVANQRIFDLPVNLLPSEFLYVPQVTSGGFAAIGIHPTPGTGAAVYRNTGSGYLPSNVMYYPSGVSGVGGWTSLTLQNSWVAYGGIYASPQYTKGADGLVSLKGFIKNGTTTAGTIIATLPAGYRPIGKVLAEAYCDSFYARIDVDTTGNITIYNGTNGWLSLDGLTFYADQ